MYTNFTECAAKFAANASLRERYGWHGPLIGLSHKPESQITLEGCNIVCGTGPALYKWEDVSSTITTWILPVIGTLLQAPFESNVFRRTLLAIARWVGSPIVSLSYVLWNIKVSAKAALMVDMAVPFDQVPGPKTDFDSMRDSMFLLLVMNQYTMKPTAMLREKEAEGLLRIVLFSKDLKLTDTNIDLRKMRRILARELREMRRRGAVPVFISTLWFLFAFALSIQAAFGVVGENRTAHDLALGCLLAWFPILILSTIVDRNPIAAEAIRKKLNALIDHVRHALRNEGNRQVFIDSFKSEELELYIHKIAAKAENMDNFFIDFAGQARIRWHYGAAHPILCDIENCYIADRGRNWLASEKEARTNLVLGTPNDEGLVWFDIREFWQVAAAVAIVTCSCGGAFILSFFTPTVGLGCRSGGYVIFYCISLGLMIMEMVVWLALSPYEMKEPRWLAEAARRLQRHTMLHDLEDWRQHKWAKLKRRTSSFLRKTKSLLVSSVVKIAVRLPFKDKEVVKEKIEGTWADLTRKLQAMSPQHKWEIFFFRPIECINTLWLVYIVTSQVFGLYKTCDCVTSNWGGGGGYLDFTVQDVASDWVVKYWLMGTFVTSVALGVSMFYITVEWCQQSFLSTEDYNEASKGLLMTRKYRHYTFLFRKISRLLSHFTFTPLERLGIAIGLLKYPQSTLLWTRKHTYEPDIPHVSDVPSGPQGSPSIELSDFSAVTLDDGSHSPHHYDTPAMAHSLFPPAIPQRRARLDSDSSTARPSPLLIGRTSNDHSTSSLLQRPNDAHHRYERIGSIPSDDGHRSSGEESLSPFPPVGEAEQSMLASYLGINTNLQTRQGYTRANSDPGSPNVVGLGIPMVDRDVEKGPTE